MTVYADNAATTKLSETALKVMLPCFTEFYGNPSSPHHIGQDAAKMLLNARHTMAEYLGAEPSEIIFTSGGSEANNQAIMTAVSIGAKKNKKHIISTKFEHHAILHTLKNLEKQGYEVTLLDVHENGIVRVDELEKAIRPDTALVTVMYANNEIGTVQPIAEIGAVCREKGVFFHTDAVQAAGHLPINVKEQNIDMLTLSAHKFHGPKGAGVFFCKRGIPISAIIHGGAQERGKRAGTENVPSIVGMAAAFKEACDNMPSVTQQITLLRDRLIAGLLQLPEVILNGDREKRLPNNVNVSIKGVEGESLLLLLDREGICASSGSACTSGSLDPSHVLLSIGLTHEVAHGSLRFSLSEYNTVEEVDYILEKLPPIVEKLRMMSPVWKKMMEAK